MVVMWECQFNRLREEDPDLKAFLDELYADGDRPRERLRIREGLRGGRTEAFRLLYEETLEEARQHELCYLGTDPLSNFSCQPNRTKHCSFFVL